VKCLAPWTNIDISPDGTIKPCCKFNNEHYNSKFNVQLHSLEEYHSSSYLNSIKQQLEQDQFPPGCERCAIDEASGVQSKRQLDYTRWHDHYCNYQFDSGFITASIAFGNTCNLTCITCSPTSSSKWRSEWKEIYSIDIPSTHNTISDGFVCQFNRLSPNLVHIDIPGGEPFLSQVSKQKDLLKHYVNTGQAKHISLHYTTNVQQFPDDDFWNLWEHFKEIDMQLSIDGIGKHFEYIRHPASWSVALKLIDQYIHFEKNLPNLRLSVSHTVSAYNVYYLDDFFNWCETVGLPKPYTG
jgi:radical SAM protein with 4Fe4S-binding SPASM domain